MPATELSAATWDREVTASPVPVLVDFWIESCQPCRAMAPAVDALAAEFSGRARVGKLDLGEHPPPAGVEIRGVPAIAVFKAGALAELAVGALDLPGLRALLGRHL